MNRYENVSLFLNQMPSHGWLMMIKTLRKKYIYSAMIAVTIVMVIYIAAINILNVYSAGHDAEKTMQLIIAEETQSAPLDRGPKGSGNAARPDHRQNRKRRP